jgi:hypothetical protein
VFEQMSDAGLVDAIGKERFYSSIKRAVESERDKFDAAR